MVNSDMLKQLKIELSQITGKFDTRSELYILLRSELSRLGYWKHQARGNASKGYRSSPIAQQTSLLRQQLRDSSNKIANDYD